MRLLSNFDLKRYMSVLEAMRTMLTQRAPRTVLVVDDSPDTLHLLTDRSIRPDSPC